MKKILFYILKILSKAVIKKYRPLVVGITGSVGKTSTKEAIYSVLKNHFKVRENIKNYNNEIGVPLTILGLESGKRSISKWFKVFFKGLGLILKRDANYPNILVLEMGADKTGDIEYLLKIVPCDISVVTAVSEVHLEFFGTLQNVIKEKQKIVSHLKESHLAILNADDNNVLGMKTLTKAKVATFGLAESADFRAEDVKVSELEGQIGTSFKLHYQGKVLPVFLTSAFGPMQVKAALAAVAVANHLQVNLIDILEDIKTYRAPAGRTNLLKGIKGTFIIDDTYNASPVASAAALDLLNEFSLETNNRKMAVFGSMLELGSFSEQGHQQVGEKAAKIKVDMLVAVGEKARDILRGAIVAGMPEEKTFYFADNRNAGLFLQNKIRKGDILLIKGSQGARMEQLVKELMADPLNAEKLLVRQGSEWMK